MKKTVIKWILIVICVIILVIDFWGFWKYKLSGTKYPTANNAEDSADVAPEEQVPTINYEELASTDFSNGEKIFITDIEKDEDESKYIIKGLIYEEYEFTKEEYDNVKAGKETIEIFGKKYSKDKISSNNLILKSSDADAEKFYIKYDTKTKKYLLKESAKNNTIYKTTEKYVKTTVNKNLDFVIEKNGKKNTSKIEKQEEFYKNIEVPKDSIKVDLCGLTFDKKGTCIKITKTEN